MRPKPTHSNSSSSVHSSAQLPFTGTMGPSATTPTSSSKPKLAKYPTWSAVSSIRQESSPITPTTSTISGTTVASNPGSQQLHQDENGPETSSSPKFEFAGATTVDDAAPVIPRNENGKRYSRQELLDVWSQMRARGLLNKSAPANFPSLPSVGTGAAKARSLLGSVAGGRAGEGSVEYEKFFARTLVPPELYPDTGLSETDSQKSPSPPAEIPLSFNDLHGELETGPFLNTPLLPVSAGSSSNSGRSTSAHFPIPALDEIPASIASPSLQNQPESILSPLGNLSLSLPDYASPFNQPVSSTWSPFSGTRTSQHAQLQPQPQQLDQDPFMPSIFGATDDQFSPIPIHHQAFPQQQRFPPPPPGLSLPPILVPAPLIQWVYLDNSSVVQGPFPGPMMHDWYLNQWLSPDLKIKRVEENEYYTLAEFTGLVGNEIDPFMVPLPPVDLDIQQRFQQQQQHPTLEQTQDTVEERANEDNEAQFHVDEHVKPEEEKRAVVPEPITAPISQSELIAQTEPEPDELTPVPSPEPESINVPELKTEPGKHQEAGWDVPAMVDNSWGVDNSWTATSGAPSPSKPSSTTAVSGKHKLQPLPPAPTLLTKLGGELVSPAATPSPTAHISVPIAPWAKSATEKKTKTQSLKEIEEREARVKQLQEQRVQQQQQRLLQRKAAEIDLTNGNVVTDDLSGNSGSIPPGLPRSATWAKAVHVPSVKKTLAQIQKEEEDARQRKAATAVANSNAVPGVMTAQGRKYAEITSSKPGTPVSVSRATTATVSSFSGGAWTTIGPGGKKAGTATSATTAPMTTIRRTVSTPVSTATASRKTGVVKPSVSADEFFKWCRSTLQGVNSGVNAEELLTMLLSLPLAGPETVEIIADTVYANSTTMDGRRFAEEFVKRRKAVEGNTEVLVALAHATGDGAVKSKSDDKASEGWNEVLVKGNAKALKTASTPGGASEGWNSAFKVVGTKKKGKR
ncbi:hypothetical protein V1520DRAFT_171018 [Lipomyces starkeyi]|uniref:GYF domain-containing protein n=1 Tax=Lipomyces starkeyi NRRL Y-11557 TaxID=675824 RepID=A0A1E3QCL1_LIPST|nr:hypothetical protein LIPSTDRAFT_25307 [Lipomyces starkeyi NRRL Y-11557]